MGSSPYSYYYGYTETPVTTSTAGLTGNFAIALIGFLAFVAVIVLTIVLCVRYLGKNGDKVRATRLGRFFNMDNYVLSKIVKALFIFCTVVTTVDCIAAPFISAAYAASTSGGLTGVGAFIVVLIIAAVVWAISMLILRVVFEFTIMVINLAIDTRALRRRFVPDEPFNPYRGAQAGAAQYAYAPPMGGQPYGAPYGAQPVNPMGQQSYAQPTQQAPMPGQQMPVQPTAEQPVAQPAPEQPSPAQTQSAPGQPSPAQPQAAPEQPSVCVQCGAPLNGSAYCTNCGAPAQQQ